MNFSIIAFGICALTAFVFGHELTSDRYPRTERILFEYPTYTFCVTKTVFSVSSEVREQKDEPTKENLEEAIIQCGVSPLQCKSYTTSTDPDKYQKRLDSVGNDADVGTLQEYAKAMPINLRLDLTRKDVKVCKDSYGRFYGINRFFADTCPLIAFAKEKVITKYSPTSPREIQFLLQNVTNKDFIRQAVNISSYRGLCRFTPNDVTYLCGFLPFSPKDTMPSQGSNFLCPGTVEKNYQYTFYSDYKFTTFGSLDIDTKDASFKPTCYAALTFNIEQLPKGKPEITLTFNFNGKPPPDVVYTNNNVKYAFIKDFETGKFVRLENSNIVQFQTDVTVDAQTLEVSMFLFFMELVRTVNSKDATHCYMTLTQPHQDRNVHVLNFGVLSLKDFKSITDNILKCESLEALEAGLFAPIPRDVRSCRVVKGSNSTIYQCCCFAMNQPCNTERVIRQYFSLQANIGLHSCQFLTHPTGACAESRYNKFRCIGVFALTESNGFRNTKEDCVSSHLDNDRAHTLCRQYGGVINPHGGTCGMMAMYNMRGDYDVDETDLPIYVCCGDAYPAIAKTLRTKVLKRIGDFSHKE
uniref:Uncharacterized protein n=1 Tax=Panagrellus redivivus TaxID=6233 RepID=A0A7E4ZTU7_PANRE